MDRGKIVPLLSDVNDLDDLLVPLRKEIRAFPGDAKRWALFWFMGLPWVNVPQRFKFLALSIQERDRGSILPWRHNRKHQEIAIVNTESMQAIKDTLFVSLMFWGDEICSLIRAGGARARISFDRPRTNPHPAGSGKDECGE
jgi:hypothetical protein